MTVQMPDNRGKETVPESGRTHFQASVSSTKQEQGEKGMTRVGEVLIAFLRHRQVYCRWSQMWKVKLW